MGNNAMRGQAVPSERWVGLPPRWIVPASAGPLRMEPGVMIGYRRFPPMLTYVPPRVPRPQEVW